MQLRMSEKEAALFTIFLERANNYLEFGMGGSTYLAAKTVKGRIASVDSDEKWIEMVRENTAEFGKDIHLHFGNIGEIVEWGHPKDRSKPEIFMNYHSEFIEKLNDNFDFDLILVDGRFRVACAAISALNMHPDAIVILHDYRSREGFHIVEEFLRPIAEAEDITAFVRRHDCNFDRIKEIFEEYKFNSA